MANVTLLLALDSARSPSEYEPPDALLGANYSVPLMWLSMFTTAEIVLWPSIVQPTVSYAALLGPRNACITRSLDRINEWTRIWPETFGSLGPAWTDFIKARQEPFFAVWTEELAEMSDSGEQWLQNLMAYLAALDQPSGPGFVDVLAQSYLAVDADGSRLIGTNQGSIGLLCAGYSWAVLAPWQ